MDTDDSQPTVVPDWAGWSDEQKDIINSHMKYTAARLELLNRALKHGPLEKNSNMLKKPVSRVDKVIYKNTDSLTNDDNDDELFIENLRKKRTTAGCSIDSNVTEIPKSLAEMQY